MTVSAAEIRKSELTLLTAGGGEGMLERPKKELLSRWCLLENADTGTAVFIKPLVAGVIVHLLLKHIHIT